MISTKQQSQ